MNLLPMTFVVTVSNCQLERLSCVCSSWRFEVHESLVGEFVEADETVDDFVNESLEMAAAFPY